MATKKETKEVEAPKVEDMNLPAGRLTAEDFTAPVSDEIASHLWQANSPAVNSNVLAYNTNPQGDGSIFDRIDTPEKQDGAAKDAKAQAKADLEAIEYDGVDDCSKLDVSDARYCQPGSERHKLYQKKTGK